MLVELTVEYLQVDATPFRQWYVTHYGQELGKLFSIVSACTQNVNETFARMHSSIKIGFARSLSSEKKLVTGKKALTEEEKKFSKTQLKKFEARRCVQAVSFLLVRIVHETSLYIFT
jgi:hypothetical protein